MSQENVDRFKEGNDWFNRFARAPTASSATSHIQAFLRFMDPEIRWEPQQASLQGSYVGLDALGGFLADLAEHYEAGHVHYHDIRDLGDRVLALGTLRVAGRGSGIAIDVPMAVVATYRDGLMTHLKDYGGDKDQALDAVGLRE